MHLLTVCIVFAVAYASPNPQDIDIKKIIKSYKTCVDTVPPEVKAIITEFKKTKLLPENPPDEFKCFILCMGKELGVVDENGKYHFERLKAASLEVVNHAMTHDEAHEAVEDCISVEHEHDCERAHLFIQCHHRKMNQYGAHEELKNLE